MEYKNVVKDFAERTKRNLEYIRRAYRDESQAQVYEVTQLINSMLGLLVFPEQCYFNDIPEIPFCKLEADGWPKIKVSPGFPQVKTLKCLMKYLRNAVAHFNMEFLTDLNCQISGVRVWNKNPKTRKTIWMSELSLDDLEKITERFIEMLTQ